MTFGLNVTTQNVHSVHLFANTKRVTCNSVEVVFEVELVIKTDENGVEQWSQIFGTDDMKAIGHSLEQTDDGGFIIGGLLGPGRKIQNNTSADAYLIKTDASGTELWSETYGGDYFDIGYSGFFG